MDLPAAISSSSELLSQLDLNDTQAELLLTFYNNRTQAVLDTETHIFVLSAIPFLLESIALGIISIVSLLLAYTHLRMKSSWKYIILLALSVGVLATHWTLTLRAISLFSPLYDDGVAVLMNAEEFICETVLFGVLTSLVFAASVLFFKPRDPNTRTPRTLPRWFLFSVIMAMYTAAATHWIVSLRLGIPMALGDLGGTAAVYCQLTAVSSATLSLSVICSDAVVLWRACAVWMYRRYIVFLSVFLILVTAVSSIANVALLGVTMSSLLTATSPSGMESIVKSADPSRSLMTVPGLVSLGISILSNVFATLAIAYKAWMHRALVRKYLTTGSRRLVTEKIMCIFVESGAVYICLWILYAVATIVPNAVPALSAYSFSMVQLAAIYPTLIIILVFLEKKAHFARDPSDADTEQLPTAHATIVTMIHSMPSEILDARLGDVDVERGTSEDIVDWQSINSEDICESKEDDGRVLLRVIAYAR